VLLLSMDENNATWGFRHECQGRKGGKRRSFAPETALFSKVKNINFSKFKKIYTCPI
jgi:hypothetical protein